MVEATLSRSQTADFVELTKPRIVTLVMVTAAAGFWLAGPTLQDTLLLFHALMGIVLVAAGTNALNQIVERDTDALMLRTKNRPMPAGRLTVTSASTFAWLTGASGVIYLALFVNLLTAFLAAATLISYVYLYTPLKRHTSLSTLVGAVPGALPIMGGWAAATGTLDPRAWVLFSILFLWQLPHFLALSWIYREDYSRAGIKMLSCDDPDGKMTFTQASLYAAALIPVSLAPTILGLAGAAYFVGALILSLGFLIVSIAATRDRTDEKAKRLFLASLIYLPALLILMTMNRSL